MNSRGARTMRQVLIFLAFSVTFLYPGWYTTIRIEQA